MKGHEEQLGFILAMTCRMHRLRIQQLLGPIGLHCGQPGLLFTLQQQNGCAQGDLAAHLNVSAPTISNMVRRLEHAGFVERRGDPADERVSRVYLTEAGWDTLEQAHVLLSSMNEVMHKGFDEAEWEQLKQFMLRLQANLAETLGQT
jgi:DNA-binding MarR family transcriptional regulator